MKTLLMILLLVSLSGCASYKFGDASRFVYANLHTVNEKYCSEENATYRAFLLTVAKMGMPFYPDEGYCGIRKMIMEMVSE